MNIEQGMMNADRSTTSTFIIPCSIFDIPSLAELHIVHDFPVAGHNPFDQRGTEALVFHFV